MQNKQNQTETSWLSQENAKGTGIFLVPDITNPLPRSVRKEFVENITYEECVKRGELALVFKWVPQTITTYSSLVNQPCQKKEKCVETCVEPGCNCWDGKCI